ncbi:uncharacterized protein FFB14_15202 [Fusarium fujikuroi]|nr:uncharacterized protein FFB14_15202 [Fusarium fujikuroi]
MPMEMQYLTTYICDDVDYWFTCMPFGLKTAPSVFQRFMDHALARCKGLVSWYMDDALVDADGREELIRRTAGPAASRLLMHAYHLIYL